MPVADIWDGGFMSFLKFRAGDWGALWEPYNVHRILWTRLLLWSDIAWFGGTGGPVVLLGFLYPLAAAALFGRIFAASWPGPKARALRQAAMALTCGAFAMWSQRTTFLLPFQSQMILVVLLPLLAVWLDYRHRPLAASLTALAALGTMLNGLFTAPMLALAAALGRNWTRMLGYLLLSAACALIYFAGFRSTEPAVAERPDLSALISFCLAYAGNPVARLFGLRELALPAGLAGLAIAAMVLTRLAAQKRLSRIDAMLLAFLAYVALGAAAAAWARAASELGDTARHVTPALFGWAALLTLVLRQLGAPHRAGMAVITALCCAILAGQIARLPPPQASASFDAAGLALAMKINDAELLALVYDPPERLPMLAERVIAARLSVLSAYPYAPARALLGAPLPDAAAAAACPAVLASRDLVSEDPRFTRITGEVTGPAPGLLAITGPDRRIIGLAMTRGDGFFGYLAAGALAPLTITGISPQGVACSGTLTKAEGLP